MTQVDALSDQIRRMVVTRARDYPHLWDDLFQEAMIAAWQELEKGSPERYAVRSAQFRVSKVVGGRPLTGEPRRPGRKDAYDTSPVSMIRHDGGSSDREYILGESADTSQDDALAACELSGAVSEAVAHLDDVDRSMVHLRFWEDREWSDIGDVLDRPAGTCSRRWTQIVRPLLRERLEHLVA